MVDMTSLLSRKADEIEPPKQIPPGPFLFRVKDVKTDRKSSNDNPFIDFEVEAIQALDGVDSEALQGLELPYNMRHSYVVTEKSLFRVRDFCKNALGIAIDGRELGEVLKDSPGHVFRGNVTHRMSNQDSSRFFAEISETFPAE